MPAFTILCPTSSCLVRCPFRSSAGLRGRPPAATLASPARRHAARDCRFGHGASGLPPRLPVVLFPSAVERHIRVIAGPLGQRRRKSCCQHTGAGRDSPGRAREQRGWKLLGPARPSGGQGRGALVETAAGRHSDRYAPRSAAPGWSSVLMRSLGKPPAVAPQTRAG